MLGASRRWMRGSGAHIPRIGTDKVSRAARTLAIARMGLGALAAAPAGIGIPS
jgi:hypothetical protein